MVNSPQFIQATQVVHNLKTTPDNNTLGQLYGLYKQATIGDNNTPQPSLLNFRDKAKWDNWNNCRGLSTYDAEVKYIMLVNRLITSNQ